MQANRCLLATSHEASCNGSGAERPRRSVLLAPALAQTEDRSCKPSAALQQPAEHYDGQPPLVLPPPPRLHRLLLRLCPLVRELPPPPPPLLRRAAPRNLPARSEALRELITGDPPWLVIIFIPIFVDRQLASTGAASQRSNPRQR